MVLTRTIQEELSPLGVYVQLVIAAAIRTDVWPFPDIMSEAVPGMMTAADLVDAALVGFDRREAITIPPLHDFGQWTAFDNARQAMLPGFWQADPAERYRNAA